MPEATQKNVKRKALTGKLCEQMTYSAREAFKRLRTNIQLAFTDVDSGCKVIGVTSAQIAEGKSTVAINLAYSLAELGKNVILIDGDMRRPSIHDKLNVPNDEGLSEVLKGKVDINKAVKRYTSSENATAFNYFTSGEIPENPSELLNSARFRKFIQALVDACDYVVIDLPPVNAVVDAINVSKVTDGMIVVLRENHCPRFVLNDCMDQLRYAKVNVLGFVMNGCVEGAGKRYQYRHHYDYRYEK